jgi:hypothetical protein
VIAALSLKIPAGYFAQLTVDLGKKLVFRVVVF